MTTSEVSRKPSAALPATSSAAYSADHLPLPLFVAELAVRWRDLDAFNHVNNSTYLTYLEEARLQWMSQIPGHGFNERAMPVLAASQLNYRYPITWPGRLKIELFCVRVGNSSITIGHRIIDAIDEEKLYSDGHVVMVWINPSIGRPVALPEAIRASIGGSNANA